MKKISILLSFLISSIAFAQEDNFNEKINKISAEACKCIAKIDINANKDVKSEEIKSCITGSIMAFQLKNQMLEMLTKVKDTLNKIEGITKVDSLTIDNGNFNIVINDTENYKEIEKKLYDNCPALKDIYFTDNQAYDNSYSDRKKAMKFYNSGQKSFQRREYEMAIVMFNKALKKDKKFAFAWDNLGYSYRKLENYKQAIRCYKKSLALDPNGKMPLMNIAVAYQLDNDLENSKKAYENYKQIYTNDPEGFYGLGRIYYIEKDYEPALENMIQAYLLYIEMDSPYNIDAQKHISFMYNELKEQDRLELFNTIAKKYDLNINTND